MSSNSKDYPAHVKSAQPAAVPREHSQPDPQETRQGLNMQREEADALEPSWSQNPLARQPPVRDQGRYLEQLRQLNSVPKQVPLCATDSQHNVEPNSANQLQSAAGPLSAAAPPSHAQHPTEPLSILPGKPWLLSVKLLVKLVGRGHTLLVGKAVAPSAILCHKVIAACFCCLRIALIKLQQIM